MRQRGISTIGAVLLSALAGLATATVLADWVVVDVRTPEPENLRIMVPFPLVIADIAMAFVPEHTLEEARVPAEVLAQKDAILGALEALANAPDGNLVEVDTPDEHVRIFMDNGELGVYVDADDAKVRCTVPLAGIHKALEGWDWEVFEPRLALKALHSAKHGPLVEVHADDGTYVKITKW
jgi:hypothetical protein